MADVKLFRKVCILDRESLPSSVGRSNQLREKPALVELNCSILAIFRRTTSRRGQSELLGSGPTNWPSIKAHCFQAVSRLLR